MRFLMAQSDNILLIYKYDYDKDGWYCDGWCSTGDGPASKAALISKEYNNCRLVKVYKDEGELDGYGYIYHRYKKKELDTTDWIDAHKYSRDEVDFSNTYTEGFNDGLTGEPIRSSNHYYLVGYEDGTGEAELLNLGYLDRLASV